MSYNTDLDFRMHCVEVCQKFHLVHKGSVCHLSMGCHYRQNSASVIFINGASNFENGASVFVNGASNFENGASVFVNGALILKMVPLIFCKWCF